MTDTINILIAEDNEISRTLMASILETRGYTIIQASDGNDAIIKLKQHTIDLALIDLNMQPKGGFELVQYMSLHNLKTPVIIITASDSSDVLTRANELGIGHVLQKPVEPSRLLSIVERILKRNGRDLNHAIIKTHQIQYTPDQLIQRAIDLAERNAQTRKGGPFGAVVSNQAGEILGEGVNGITSRIDPTAHAEIIAIRHAAEKLERSDLSDCTLYCSSEPTMMGQALIISVGIKQVYYGLSHTEIKDIRIQENKVRTELVSETKRQTAYTQLGHDNAMTMFKRWQVLDDKITD